MTRRTKFTLATVLALAAALVSLLIGAFSAGSMLSAPAMRDVGPLPKDLTGEEVRIPSESGSSLAAWVIPGLKNYGVVVLMHGVHANRLDMLGRARFLSKSGFGVLLFGFQAHDESPGERITFGYLESRDATAAVDYARKRFPDERIGVLGLSMGGAAAILAQPPLQIDAAILEMMYPTIEEAIANRLRMRLGPMGGWLTPLFTLQLPLRQGISATQLLPIDRVKDLHAPLLFIAGDKDGHTTLAESHRLFEAAGEPKKLWVVRGARHQDLQALMQDDYGEMVLEFLGPLLKKTQ